MLKPPFLTDARVQKCGSRHALVACSFCWNAPSVVHCSGNRSPVMVDGAEPGIIVVYVGAVSIATTSCR